jgi:hypothetical protein
MYSTWRSGESRGYCALHRRGLKLDTAFSADVRRYEPCELLGERPIKEAAGDNRGRPLVWRLFEAERESLDGRYGSVVAIFGGD